MILLKKRQELAFKQPFSINAFWWNKKKNFGDLITPELLRKFNVTAEWTPEAKADVVGVGSLMHLIPEKYTGTFLGTGLIEDKKMSFPNASFAAVRGELTKRNLGLDQNVQTGDLGLIADLLIESEPEPQFEIGLVPHFVDFAHPWVKFMREHCKKSLNIIDVRNSAEFVTREIAKCRRIYSSSLHGLIVADSMGIPNTWIEMSDKVIGKGFKFHDYNSALNYEQQPVKILDKMRPRAIDRGIAFKPLEKIAQKKESLTSMLSATLADCKK